MMKKIPIRDGVSDYHYRVEEDKVYIPLTKKEIDIIDDLIYQEWTSKVDMKKKGKTPSDIPVPPIKYQDLLFKLSHAVDSLDLSEYQYGKIEYTDEEE